MGTIQSIATLISAIGTVAAVVLALFLQVVIVRKRRPRLTLELAGSLEDDDLAYVEEYSSKGVDPVTEKTPRNLNLHVRPKVRNAFGKDTAKNVQVALLRVRGGAPDDSTVPSRPIAWSDIPDERINIPSGSWNRIDLLNFWRKLDSSDKDTGPLLSLGVRGYGRDPWPPAMRQRLTQGIEYALDLVLTADNCDATFWTFTFSTRSEKYDVERPRDFRVRVSWDKKLPFELTKAPAEAD